MREKLIEYIMNNFEGMHEFRKEYENISDKLLLEDAKMLQKLYPSKELKNILDELIGDD
jgi:hypothetical protein